MFFRNINISRLLFTGNAEKKTSEGTSGRVKAEAAVEGAEDSLVGRVVGMKERREK